MGKSEYETYLRAVYELLKLIEGYPEVKEFVKEF